MATATRPLASVPVEAISEHADQVRVGQVLATVIAAIGFAIGWTIGSSWRGVVFFCVAIRYGYRQGAHIPVAPRKGVEQ
jgi:hypothetical protein